MKKRLIPLLLALAMALPLAVPAFAVVEDPDSGSLTVDLTGVTGEGGPVHLPEDRSFKVRDFTDSDPKGEELHLRDGSLGENAGTFILRKLDYQDATRTLGALTLPQGKQFVWKGVCPTDDPMGIRFTVYADPDGDGVYDQQVVNNVQYSYQKHGYRTVAYSGPNGDGSYTHKLVDADPEKGLTYVPYDKERFYLSSARYSNWAPSSFCANGIGIQTVKAEDGSLTITVDSDSVYDVFGCDTLLDWGFFGPIQEREDGTGISHCLANGTLLVTRDIPSFTDTPSWCEQEAAWAAQKGITKGYGSKDKFAPGVECSQVEILTFLWRAADEPEAKEKAPVTVASWYQDAVDWAYGEGYIGDDFQADAPCTRAQAVSYIWKALGEKKAGKPAGFPDVAEGAPYAAAADWAYEVGVIKSYGGTGGFAPSIVCSRGQIACMLYRAYN